MPRVSHLHNYATRQFILALMMAGLASLFALLPHSVSGRSLSGSRTSVGLAREMSGSEIVGTFENAQAGMASSNYDNSTSPRAASDIVVEVTITAPEEGATFPADSNIEITAMEY